MTNIISETEKYEIDYNIEMLRTEIFGAIFSLYEFRKSDVGLTKTEVARRGGWSDRSFSTKYLSGPQNFTTDTISRICTALGADFKFVLIDRTNRSRCFNAGGLALDLNHAQGAKALNTSEQQGWMTEGQRPINLAQRSAAPRASFEEEKQVATFDGQQVVEVWK